MSAFWRRKVDLPAMLGPVTSHRRWPSLRSQSLATNGPLPPRFSAVAHHARARPALGLGEVGEAGCDVDQRERAGGLRDAVGACRHFGDEVGEQAQLQCHRLVGGLRDLGLQLAQLDGGEAGGVGGRLALDEAAVRLHLVMLRRGRLDEIAQHVVVLDFERADAEVGAVARLQLQDQLARIVAQRAPLVEVGQVAGRDEAAVARQQRQALAQRARQAIDQVAVMAEVGQRLAQQRRRRAETCLGEQRLDAGRRQQAVADGGEVARAAAVQRQARQRALQVRRFLQVRAQVLA
jgi:hypothetical protein